MSEFAVPLMISTPTQFSDYTQLEGVAASFSGSAAWPTANKAFYMPFRIPASGTIRKLFWVNGATLTGNVSIGLYSATGAGMAVSGSLARSGANAIQEWDMGDLDVDPQNCYIGFSASSAVGSYARSAQGANLTQARLTGTLEEVSAFPLPATATFAQLSATYIPLVGMAFRTLV